MINWMVDNLATSRGLSIADNGMMSGGDQSIDKTIKNLLASHHHISNYNFS